ncbi:hypothetical protein ES705_46499 [subsurface metagenome]
MFGCLLQADKILSAGGRVESFESKVISSVVDNFKNTLPKKDSPIINLRNELYRVVEKASAQKTPGLFSLTAPTGSGKTINVLNAVLKIRDQIQKNNKVQSRIIYCLPFTSIIEQNYEVFEKVLKNSGYKITSDILLKHHHLTDLQYETDDPEFDPDNSSLFVETWQSEIIVTTFYQLLYTIFTNRNKNLKYASPH